MDRKPTSVAGYTRGKTELVRATCLYVATKLGDLSNHITLVGGLVPSLLVPQGGAIEGIEDHAGTVDVDVGLSLALLNQERYHELSKRLRNAGFAPDTNEKGNPTFQRWTVAEGVSVDFLIPPSDPADEPGTLRHLEHDLAAIITGGLSLVMKDRRRIAFRGRTILNEQASRKLWVCGPGSFVVLKALAFRGRGENKDAYDLFYMLRNFGQGVDEVASSLRQLGPSPEVESALRIIRDDFIHPESLGPCRVAAFLHGHAMDETQAEVAALALDLLDAVEKLS